MSETNGSTVEPRKVVNGLGEIGHDVIELVELQVELVKADCVQSMRRTTIYGIVAIIGTTLALAAFPVLLFALAHMLTHSLEWPLFASLLVAGFLGLFLGAGLAIIALYGLRKATAIFHRSKSELVENIRAIKKLLKSASSHSPKTPTSA